MFDSSFGPGLRSKAIVVFAALHVAACFKPEFRADLECGAAQACPTGYTCQSDNVCRPDGTAEPADASSNVFIDGSSATDATVVPEADARVPITVDVGDVLLWSATLDRGPALALWPDGTLIAAPIGFGTAKLVSPTGLVSEMTSYNGNRPSISLGATPQVYNAYQDSHALTQDEQPGWTIGIGCCRFSPHPSLALDESSGVGYGLSGGGSMARVSLATGALLAEVPQDSTFSEVGAITGSTLYLHGNAVGTITRVDATTLTKDWTRAIGAGSPAPRMFPIALADDDSVIAASQEGQAVARVRPDGSVAWNHVLTASSPPVVTEGDLTVLGIIESSATLTAYQVSDGEVAWSTPVTAPVSDVLVADNGLVYALLGTLGTVIGVDAATGEVFETYTGVPAAEEMLLRDGTLFVAGPSEAMAFTVTATSYAPGSPWPVRYHDNQRTSRRQASLAF